MDSTTSRIRRRATAAVTAAPAAAVVLAALVVAPPADAAAGPRSLTPGFLLERGRYTTIDVPGAAATSLVDINDRSQILGAYADDQSTRPGTFHGFVLDRGRLRTFDGPGGTLLLPADLNNRGQIVGSIADPTSETARGFLLARGVNGPFTPVSFPCAQHPGVRPERPRPDHRHLQQP